MSDEDESRYYIDEMNEILKRVGIQDDASNLHLDNISFDRRDCQIIESFFQKTS